jgi:hypothetical protein
VWVKLCLGGLWGYLNAEGCITGGGEYFSSCWYVGKWCPVISTRGKLPIGEMCTFGKDTT